MGKLHSHGKKSAWDKPGPSDQFLASMRAESAARASRSDAAKDEREADILNSVRKHAKLTAPQRQHFLEDTRGALRRVRDGAAATPCSGWSKKGCTKCKTKRVGDKHHIFCEERETFKHQYEKELARELRRDIEKLHRDTWAMSEAASSSTLLFARPPDAQPDVTSGSSENVDRTPPSARTRCATALHSAPSPPLLSAPHISTCRGVPRARALLLSDCRRAHIALACVRVL